MWVEDVEDIGIEYEQDGILVIKQVDKAVITRGTWATIAFLYREWDARANDYGPVKVTLRKYRKQRGAYRQESKFNLGSLEQAAAVAEVLARWAKADE